MERKDHSQSLTAVLNAMEDGIYIVNNQYTIEFMNKAMVDDFGEGVGRKCYEVIGKQDGVCSWCMADDVFKKRKRSTGNIISRRQTKHITSSKCPFEILTGPHPN